MIVFRVIILLVLSTTISLAHPWKPEHYVIIDTDGGVDDLRALCLLLSAPDVRVLAITVSQGVTSPDTGYRHLKALLRTLHHEGLLTAANPSVELRLHCKTDNTHVWGGLSAPIGLVPDAVTTIDQVLQTTKEPITFLSLGSLSTFADCLAKLPQFASRIRQVIWSSDWGSDPEDFNGEMDRKASEVALNSKVPFVLIGGLGQLTLSPEYDPVFLSLPTGTAKVFSNSLRHAKGPFSRILFDERVALFLHHPELFEADTTSANNRNVLRTGLRPELLNAALVDILAGHAATMQQVFKTFPMDSVLYQHDLQEIMDSAIIRYGMAEWASGVLANELHRHLGIYAIIGVKMGIRVLEYFGAGVDEMTVVSYAGLNPPFSCLNDGLQVSTGATLGHGLISVSTDGSRLPAAKFTYLGRSVRVSLKDEYKVRIEQEIRELSRIHGLESSIYWDLVRLSAIKYWAVFDRNEIFTILAEGE